MAKKNKARKRKARQEKKRKQQAHKIQAPSDRISRRRSQSDQQSVTEDRSWIRRRVKIEIFEGMGERADRGISINAPHGKIDLYWNPAFDPEIVYIAMNTDIVAGAKAREGGYDRAFDLVSIWTDRYEEILDAIAIAQEHDLPDGALVAI